MKKVEGLKKLEGLGLNTPTTWVLDPMKKGEEEEMDISLSLIRTLIEATWNRISLRTDTEDMMSPYDSERKGFHFPFFYDLPLKEALKIAAELSKQGWAVLLSETVKKEDCIVRGNMGIIKRE